MLNASTALLSIGLLDIIELVLMCLLLSAGFVAYGCYPKQVKAVGEAIYRFIIGCMMIVIDWHNAKTTPVVVVDRNHYYHDGLGNYYTK